MSQTPPTDPPPQPGDRIRAQWDDKDGQERSEEATVLAARPAGRYFVDIELDDGTRLYMVHNYEVIERAPASAAQSATVDDTALIERAAIALARGDTGEAKWWSDDAHRAHEQVYGPLLAAKAAEIDRWRQLYGDLANLVEQRIAELFPDLFPRFPGDSGTDDRCVGDQVPESLLAMVCTEVNRLRKVDAELAAKVPTAQPATVDYNALRELYVAAVRRGAGLAEELKRARVELAAKDAEIERVTRQRDQFSAYYLDEAKSHDETLGAVWRLRSELTSARARQDVVPADAVGQIAARVHDVLCDCHGNHTGMTIRSTDFDKIRAGVRPLIESWRPATEPAEATESYACTDECRDEHCVHPIACETRGQCPPQNPALRPGDGFDASRPFEHLQAADATPAEPRVFRAGDTAPDSSVKLRDSTDGFIWETSLVPSPLWANEYGQWMPWERLVRDYGPLAEVPTEGGDRG